MEFRGAQWAVDGQVPTGSWQSKAESLQPVVPVVQTVSLFRCAGQWQCWSSCKLSSICSASDVLLSADALSSVLPFLFEEGGKSVPVCAPVLSTRPLPHTVLAIHLGTSPTSICTTKPQLAAMRTVPSLWRKVKRTRLK